MIITAYLSSTKDQMYEKGREAGLSEEALAKFMYALYEVKFDLDVNWETGESKIIKVDGRKLNDGK